MFVAASAGLVCRLGVQVSFRLSAMAYYNNYDDRFQGDYNVGYSRPPYYERDSYRPSYDLATEGAFRQAPYYDTYRRDYHQGGAYDGRYGEVSHDRYIVLESFLRFFILLWPVSFFGYLELVVHGVRFVRARGGDTAGDVVLLMDCALSGTRCLETLHTGWIRAGTVMAGTRAGTAQIVTTITVGKGAGTAWIVTTITAGSWAGTAWIDTTTTAGKIMDMGTITTTARMITCGMATTIRRAR